MSTPTSKLFNQRKGKAYMISDNQSICPKCGGQLKYYDKQSYPVLAEAEPMIMADLLMESPNLTPEVEKEPD